MHFDPCRCIALSFDRQPIWIQQSKTGSRSREAKNRVAPSLGIDPICLSHFSMPGYETSQDRSKIDLICRSAGQSCLPFSVQILPILAPFLPQQCSPQFLFDQLTDSTQQESVRTWNYNGAAMMPRCVRWWWYTKTIN